MQVNNCTEPKPSFGMALKIKTKDLKSLARHMNLEDAAKLEKAGKDLADTKFYDLEIGEYGSRKITSATKQLQGDTFAVEHPRNSRIVPYSADWAGESFSNIKYGDKFYGYLQFSNSKAAQDAYMDIAKSYGLERDAKMVKYLDEDAKRSSQGFNNPNKITQTSESEKQEVLSRLQALKNKYGE